MQDKQLSLKPLDIVVALQLTITPECPFSAIGAAVGISHGEAHNSFRRLQRSRLTRPEKRSIAVERLLSFILGGVPVAYPASFGAETRGVPTAHSAPPMTTQLATDEEPLVWADAEGTVRGTTLTPLFPRAPALARSNQPLYELLALVDSIRIGRPGETAIATSLLRDRLLAASRPAAR